MLLPLESTALVLEAGLRGLKRLRDIRGYRHPDAYFDPGEPRPEDPSYFDRFEEIHDRFPQWLDPGPVRAPEPAAVRRRGRLLDFPSPRPSGDPRVDRAALRLYPAPPGAPPVGVLFHHWLGMGRWRAADWLLAPLARRFRVAAMVAPHHLGRCAPGRRRGEGFCNPNPRHMFEGFRQWLADHLACLELLRRDWGFDRVILVGYSLGAYGSLLHRLVRPPLPTVALCSTNHYTRGVFEGAHTASLVRGLHRAGFTRETFERATRSLHLTRWGGEIGGEQLTWIHARHDRIEPADSLREARRALAPERIVEVDAGHVTAIFHRRLLLAEVTRLLEGARTAGGRARFADSWPGRRPPEQPPFTA